METAASDFKVGQRVQVAPHHDCWMAGDRYGTVTRVGRSIVHVRMDKSNRVRWFHPPSLSALA